MTINKVNARLTNEGVSEISEEEYEELIQHKISELESIIGVDLTPRFRKQYTHNFNGEVYQLNFYPVKSISSLKINDTVYVDYFLNEDSGLIYLDTVVSGKVLVEYVSCIPLYEFEHYFAPLLDDMVIYEITNVGNIWDGVASSIREGDVSIGYDVSNSLGNRIWSRIAELKDKYSSKVRMI